MRAHVLFGLGGIERLVQVGPYLLAPLEPLFAARVVLNELSVCECHGDVRRYLGQWD